MLDKRYQIFELIKWRSLEITEAPKIILVSEEAFVDATTQLLAAMLRAIQLQLSDVQILLVTPNLQQQIQALKPNLIVAFGEAASHYLLQTKSSLESLRDTIHRYDDIPLFVTYHPEHLLRNPADKKKAYSDLLSIQRALKGIEDANISQPTEQILSTSTT